MALFECCRYCSPSKRSANCHANCEAYKKDKALLDERNKRVSESKGLESYFMRKKCYKSWKY